jgi:hypothetical protein
MIRLPSFHREYAAVVGRLVGGGDDAEHGSQDA